MKKLLLLLALGCSMASCDYILKKREDKEAKVGTNKNVVLGTDKDANGCVTSAGYRWSVLRDECIRPVEEGYRLNSIQQLKDEEDIASAFVLFEEDGDRAELFLPDGKPSVMLKKESDNGPYKAPHWNLALNKNYSLKKDGQLVYAGAQIEEGQITGTDEAEN